MKIEIEKLKLKIEIENWNWKLKLKIEIENWNWKLKLKIEIENWNWKLKLKIEIENWNWKLKLKTKIDIVLKMKIKLTQWVSIARVGIFEAKGWPVLSPPPPPHPPPPKANAKRGLTCCPQDSYKQLSGNGIKFTYPWSLTMGSSEGYVNTLRVTFIQKVVTNKDMQLKY